MYIQRGYWALIEQDGSPGDLLDPEDYVDIDFDDGFGPEQRVNVDYNPRTNS
jgi:hypothetical protein